MSESPHSRQAESTSGSANKKKYLAVLTGWALSLSLLGLAFFIVPIGEVWEAIRRVSLTAMLLAMLCSCVSISLRGWRWASILGVRQRVPVFEASRITTLSLAINGIIPGRVGDVARVGLAMRSFTTNGVLLVASVVIERLLDAITLLVFLGVGIAFVGPGGIDAPVEILGNSVGPEKLFSVLVSLGTMIAVVLMLFGLLMRGVGVSFLVRCVSLIPVVGERFSEKLAAAVDDLSGVLRDLHRPSVIFRLGMQSLAIWMPLVVGNLVVAGGVNDLSLTLGQVLVVTVASIAAAALPSAPGAWGVFEAGVFLSLKAARVPALGTTILAYAFTTHFCQYVPVMLMGALAVTAQRKRS